jgi:hypothetical protein
VTSPRDEIWIDMMQFDVRAADSLWEGSAPPEDAPRWYGDVSGLIVTSRGPAEPHELVDEPIVVRHMHRTTLARRPRDCHRGRTLGRVIAVKAGAATAASVFGVTVAVAAAATTGVVASMARLAAPVIEEHVVLAQDGPSLAGTQETHVDDRLMALTEAPAAISTPATSPPPATPDRPAASVTHAPATPAVEPTVGAAPPATPAPLEPVATEAVTAAPEPPPATKGAKPAHAKHTPPAKKAPPDTPPDEAPEVEPSPPAGSTPATERGRSPAHLAHPANPSSSKRASKGSG